MLSIISWFYNFKIIQLAGGKGVRGEFRLAGSGSGSLNPFWSEFSKFCFELEFVFNLGEILGLFFRKRFELESKDSILVHLYLQVQRKFEFFLFVRALYSRFYQPISATPHRSPRLLFFPVVCGSWVQSTLSRIRRSFKNLQTLLSNFFFVPLEWNTKQVYPVCKADRKTRAFKNILISLSKGYYLLSLH
jgi:hypothetical protein